MTVTAVAPSVAGVQVGDFFVSSWGYDQTNVDFYKVVGLTPKGVKVQKWSMAATDSTHPSADYMVPSDGGPVTRTFRDYETGESTIHVEPVISKRLQSYDGGKSVYLTVGHSNAYLWDGKPKYQTGWGYGH